MNENALNGSGHTGTLTGHDEADSAMHYRYALMTRLSVDGCAKARTPTYMTTHWDRLRKIAAGSGTHAVVSVVAHQHPHIPHPCACRVPLSGRTCRNEASLV